MAGGEAWRTTLTVPSNLPAGTYAVDIECRGGPNGGLLGDALGSFTVTTADSASQACRALKDAQDRTNAYLDRVYASLSSQGATARTLQQVQAARDAANARYGRLLNSYC